MPCDMVRRVTLDLNVANKELLLRALNAMGALYVREYGGTINGYLNGVRFDIVAGKITADQRYINEIVNPIKQAYSREVVKAASQKFGWSLHQKSPQQLRLVKRAF